MASNKYEQEDITQEEIEQIYASSKPYASEEEMNADIERFNQENAEVKKIRKKN